jgi:Flp pilus assembly protein TadB
MADVVANDESSRRRLLWDLSSERRAQARHSEALRASVATYVLTAASGVIAVITHDGVNRHDFPLAVVLVAIGVMGMLFSATYTERYHRNRNRASKLLRELDNAVSTGSTRSTFQIEDEADKEHLNKRRFSVVRSLASSHWLWLAFPFLVAIVGGVLVGQCLRN